MKPKFLTPMTEKQVSPRAYQKLAQQQRGNIKSVDIVPPRLGTPGFGGLRVRFKTPVLG